MRCGCRTSFCLFGKLSPWSEPVSPVGVPSVRVFSGRAVSKFCSLNKSPGLSCPPHAHGHHQVPTSDGSLQSRHYPFLWCSPCFPPACHCSHRSYSVRSGTPSACAINSANNSQAARRYIQRKLRMCDFQNRVALRRWRHHTQEGVCIAGRDTVRSILPS